MNLQEKYRKLNYHAEKTHDEAMERLEENGKVLVIRPTGFGKTRLLIRIGKEYATKTKKKVLYVYPLNIIKTEILHHEEYMTDGIISKYFVFESYHTLALKNRTEGSNYWRKRFKDYGLVILDEAHRAGSDGFMEVYDNVKDLEGLKMIGATATPNRMMDTEESAVVNSIFENNTVYDFSLGDAYREDIMEKTIIACRRYNVEDIAKQLKEECKRRSSDFNENVFNVELGKTLQQLGGEPEYIYKYIKKANYNLLNDDESYFKFIVFFTNIADMQERGPIAQEWFNKAFNTVAKKELNFRRDFKVNCYYVASTKKDVDGKYNLDEVIKEDNFYYINNTEKLSELKPQRRTVDLLFTVNMINMGYHVAGISGIMMLRGTRSEIVYYQQLGRALSVASNRSAIVYDMVRNKDLNFWFKKNAKGERTKELTGMVLGSREAKDLELDIFVEDDEDEFDSFVNRWSEFNYSTNQRIIWLYTEKHAPVVVIANETGKSCEYVVSVLNSAGIKLKPEDAMYGWLKQKSIKVNDEIGEKQVVDKNKFSLLRFVLSKQVTAFTKFFGTTLWGFLLNKK